MTSGGPRAKSGHAILDPVQAPRRALHPFITVGRGPYTVVTSTVHKKLYVTNFLENTLAVVDIDPDSLTYNRVVLRIGVPKTP